MMTFMLPGLVVPGAILDPGLHQWFVFYNKFYCFYYMLNYEAGK